jgi:hypothetical protein
LRHLVARSDLEVFTQQVSSILAWLVASEPFG